MTLREAAKKLRTQVAERMGQSTFEQEPGLLQMEVLAMLCERVAEIAPAADRPLED